jgi:hypothetical protein
MILSKRHKFVYLKGQKVASTSVELALSAICGDEDIITLMDPIDERRRMELGIRPAQNFAESREAERAYLERLKTTDPAAANDLKRPKSPYRPHMSFNKLTKVYGPLDDFFIFGVDRNPYAKVISLANMRQSYRRSYRQGGEMKGDEDKLGDTLRRTLKGGLSRIDNLKRYSDSSGKLRAQVLRYENLQEELAALAAERGWPDLPPLPHAKKGISANERDYRATFTPDQIARVNQLLSRDFEVNGYDKLS